MSVIAPSGLGIGTVTPTGFIASWDNGEVYDEIQFRYAPGSTLSLTGTDTSKELSTLSENTSYTVDLRGRVGASWSDWCTAVVQLTPLLAPTGLDSSLIIDGKTTASWVNETSNQSHLQVQYSTDGVAYIDLPDLASYPTSVEINFGGAWYVRIRAKNIYTTNYSAWVGPIQAAYPLPAPTSPILTPLSSTTARLDWTDASTGETGFKVEKSLDGLNFTVTDSVGAGVQTYTFTGLTPEVKIWARVCAYETKGNGYYSAIVSGTPASVAMPSNVEFSATNNSITARWVDNSNNEDGFKIYLDGVLNYTTGPNETEYTITGLSAETWYKLEIEAFNATDSSGLTEERRVFTSDPPAAPSDPALVVVSSSSIRANWTDNSGNETGFSVEKSTDGVNFAEHAAVGANITTLLLTGLSSNTQYWIRIRAQNASGYSGYSAVANTVTFAAIAMPTNLSLRLMMIAGTFYIEGRFDDNSSEEDSHEVYKKVDSGAYALLETLAANKYFFYDSDVEDDHTYYYYVRAKQGGSYSSNSAAASIGTFFSAIPSVVMDTTQRYPDKLSMTIAGNQYAIGYVIQRSPDDATWADIADVPYEALKFYVATGLTAGTLYYFRLKVTEWDGTVSYSSSTSATTPSEYVPTEFEKLCQTPKKPIVHLVEVNPYLRLKGWTPTLMTTVTAAGTRIDPNAANAFIDAAADLSAYVGASGATKYRIEATDAAGKVAVGYLGPAGAGETTSEKLTDGGLEAWTSATNLTNWYEGIGGTSTVNQETVDMHGGSNCARLDVDASNSLCYIRGSITLVAGALHRLTFWYKNSASGKTCMAQLNNTGANVYLQLDGTWKTSAAYLTLPNATSWTQYTLYFNAHASYTAYYLYLSKSSAASSSVEFDDASVVQITDPDSTGLHVYDGYNSTARGWDSYESGFNPITIASYSIYSLLTYEHAMDYPEIELEDVYENGVRLSETTSIANVDATAGLWYHDFHGGKVYIHPSGGDSPSNYMLLGSTWLYFTNWQRGSTTFNDHQYLPLIPASGLPTITQRLEKYWKGSFVVTHGSISFINGKSPVWGNKHYFDERNSTFIWLNRKVKILAGGENFAYADFSTLAVGVITDTKVEDRRFTVSMRDPRESLHRSLPLRKYSTLDFPNLFSGAGSADEGSGDVLRPFYFGACTHVAPVCIDTVNKIFELMDASSVTEGRITSVESVTLNGTTLSAGTDYYIDYGMGRILLDETVAYTTNDSLLVSFTGAAWRDGTAIDLGPWIFFYLLYRFMGLTLAYDTDINMESIFTSAAALTEELAVKLYKDTSTADLIELLEKSCLAYSFQDAVGRIGFRVDTSTAPSDVAYLPEQRIIEVGRADSLDDVFAEVQVFYDEWPTTQRYRWIKKQATSLSWMYGILRQLEIHTAHASESNALGLGSDILDVLNLPLFSITTTRFMMPRQVGDKFYLTRTRFFDDQGTANDRLMRIKEISKDPGSATVQIVAEEA